MNQIRKSYIVNHKSYFMNIGFDLDKIFINYPPFVPGRLIDWLYKKHNHNLSYRIPKVPEQLLRRVSHISFLRPPIANNIAFIHNFPNNPHTHKLYLVSSRYNFLKKTTDNLLKRYGLTPCFSGIYLNQKNEQPHLFKEQVIKNLNLDIFIDDDLDLLKYLQTRLDDTLFLWYNPEKVKIDHKGIIEIGNLKELTNYIT